MLWLILSVYNKPIILQCNLCRMGATTYAWGGKRYAQLMWLTGLAYSLVRRHRMCPTTG